MNEIQEWIVIKYLHWRSPSIAIPCDWAEWLPGVEAWYVLHSATWTLDTSHCLSLHASRLSLLLLYTWNTLPLRVASACLFLLLESPEISRLRTLLQFMLIIHVVPMQWHCHFRRLSHSFLLTSTYLIIIVDLFLIFVVKG